VVGREGAGEIEAALSEESSAGQSVRAQLGAGGSAKEKSFEAEEDWEVVRASGGEGVGPFRNIRGEKGASKG